MVALKSDCRDIGRQNGLRLGPVLRHLAGLLAAAVFILPLYWAVVASLRRPGLPPASTVEWWPAAPSWGNYLEVFRLVPMGRYLLNSLFVIAIAVPLTLLIASLAGFGLAQLPAALRRRLFTATVLLLMVPGMAVWLFRFRIFLWLGLIDTLWALVVPALAGGSPLFVLLFFWAYRRVPDEVYESARLDGAGPLLLWARIGQPLAWPTTAAVAVLAFVLYWSDFTSPVLYLYRPESYTVAVGLQILNQMDSTNYPLLMAGAVMMALPAVLLFLLVQRFFLRDLSIRG